MKTPPVAGSVVRVGIALLLCAACFQAGRSYQQLSASAVDGAKADSGTELVDASFVGPAQPGPAETAPAAAPGDPAGAGGDIITPLNVRDPSALVMGPGDYYRSCPAADPAPPEPPAKATKPRKMKEGRLLELLKKEDRPIVVPKHY